MDRKKIIITIVIILGVAVCGVVIYRASNKTAGVATNSSESSNVTDSTARGSLPSQPAPSVQPSRTDTIAVSNPTDKAVIWKAFNDFVSKNQSEPFTRTVFQDANNKSVSLPNFASAVGLAINGNLNNLLDQTTFNLFSCPSAAGAKNIGLVVTLKFMPDYKGNLYQDETAFMKAWEKTLLPDTHNLLLPTISFTPEQLSQPLVFKDGKYRYADVVLPDGSESSINYQVVEDYIILSTSAECLSTASEGVYDTSS